MKQYKNEILERLEQAAISDKIIEFKEIAYDAGFTRMKTQDVLEICNKFLKLHDDYKLVRMVKNEKDISSLFCTATLIDKTLEFD